VPPQTINNDNLKGFSPRPKKGSKLADKQHGVTLTMITNRDRADNLRRRGDGAEGERTTHLLLHRIIMIWIC